LKISRWRTAAILKIKNLQYRCIHSTDLDEILQEHTDRDCKPRGRSIFAHLKQNNIKQQLHLFYRSISFYFIAHEITASDSIESHQNQPYHGE